MTSRILLLFALMLLNLQSASAEPNPHEITKLTPSDDCKTCHLSIPDYTGTELLESKNKTVNLAGFSKDGVAMCTGCHDPKDGHKIGLKLDFDVPADMPLDKKKSLSCLTCHYSHGKLASDRPQASFSFMDRLMDAERLHKSYLLRRNNVNGELCLICHNPEQGKK
jgi:hypothetical protein